MAAQIDPWKEMAIERQFRKVVQEPEDEFPATLKWLQEAIQNRKYLEDYPLVRAHDALMTAFLEGRFATALVGILWPEQSVEESMEDTLDSPGQLASELTGAFIRADL